MSLAELAIIGALGVGAVVFTIYVAATRKSSGQYLCENCKFNDPEACLKPERPKAIVCTSFRKKS